MPTFQQENEGLVWGGEGNEEGMSPSPADLGFWGATYLPQWGTDPADHILAHF